MPKAAMKPTPPPSHPSNVTKSAPFRASRESRRREHRSLAELVLARSPQPARRTRCITMLLNSAPSPALAAELLAIFSTSGPQTVGARFERFVYALAQEAVR